MDAEQAKTQIRAEVQNALVDSQNVMMTEMRTLITGEMKKLQTHNQKLAESQMAKVEEALDGSYKFKRRGNEEQNKHNVKVIRKLQEANTALSSKDMAKEKIQKCREHIAEGIDIVTHREKLVKLADSSESAAGWRVVQEYQANPLAEDSEDEKRISKAQNRADKKVKAEKEKRKETNRRYFARNGNASASASKPYSRIHRDKAQEQITRSLLCISTTGSNDLERSDTKLEAPSFSIEYKIFCSTFYAIPYINRFRNDLSSL